MTFPSCDGAFLKKEIIKIRIIIILFTERYRQLFTMHRSMHPQSDVDHLYWKRAEGGRGLKSVEEVVELEKASLGYYLGQTEETLLKEVVRDGLFTESVEPKRKKQEIMKRRKAKAPFSVFQRNKRG